MYKLYNRYIKTITFSILIMALAVMNGQSVHARSYDLEAFLSAVNLQNKDIKLAEKEKDMAEIQKKEAFSTALPSIGFETGYTRNLSDYYMYLDTSSIMPGASGVIKAPMKRDNELSSTVAVRQTLYSSSVGSAIKASRQYDQLSGFVFSATHQNVLAGARKLFYQCLFLEKVLDVAVSAEKNALENYSVMKLKYENGQVSEFDLLQAETRWRSAIPEIQMTERNLKLAMNSMKNMAGIDINENITLEGNLDNRPAMPEKVAIGSVFDARPDFQALTWEKKLRKTNLEATKGAYLPKITGTLAYAYSSQSNKIKLDEENNLWFVGVNLSVPIFTGGNISAQIQKAQVDLQKTAIKMEKTRESISTDIVNAYLRLEEAMQRINSADATRRTAEKAFQIADITTRDGLTTQLQLKDARFGFDQSTINYYAAVYDYLAAYFDWELAVGKGDL
jgi:outer membrane protein